jgi:hypothetical protein
MTEITNIGKVWLFLSSYTPLWIIFFGNLLIKNGLILFNYPTNDNLRIFSLELSFLIILAISVLSTMVFLREIRKTTNPKKITVNSRENITGEYVLYVVNYVIPFLVTEFTDQQLFTLVVMLFFVIILYVRSNLIHVNPMFALFGYRLFAITDEESNMIHILSKRVIHRDDELNLSMIDYGFYAEVD